MGVKRIVANIAAASVPEVRDFYADLFELDFGWIATLGAEAQAPAQISVASEGGSGTPVPDLSIEVDDVDAVFAHAKSLGHPIAYPLTNEPWGVRRFYICDPTGKTINVLAHLS